MKIKRIVALLLSATLGMINFPGGVSAMTDDDSSNPTLDLTSMPSDYNKKVTFDIDEIDEAAEEDFTTEHILIELSHDISFEAPSLFTPEFLGLTNVLSITPLFEDTRIGILNGEPHLQQVKDNFNQILAVTLEKQTKDGIMEAVGEANQNPYILTVTPDFLGADYSEEEELTAVMDPPLIKLGDFDTEDVFDVEETSNPDFRISNFWQFDMINLYDAWQITTGSKNVKVGIVDSGILDIGTVKTALSPNVAERQILKNGGTVADSTISSDHGTFVGAVVGTIPGTYGSLTMSGICQEVSLISMKSTVGTSHLTSLLLQALADANTQKIPILNRSAGGYTAPNTNTQNLIRSAFNNYYGILSCSAGNNRDYDVDNTPGNDKHYISEYNMPNMISVGAVDSNGNNYYCYGTTTIHIAAPGLALRGFDIDGAPRTGNGTSYAAPQVAGTAALILSKYPSLENDMLKVKQAILDGATVSSKLQGKIQGARLLNVKGALDEAAKLAGGTTQTVKITSSVNTVEAGKTITITATSSPSGTITWTSSDTSVATVNASTGVVTGKKAGKTTITATCNGVKATVEVTVTAAPTSGVPVKPTITKDLNATAEITDASVLISVTASVTDGGTLSYEWYKDGTKLAADPTILPSIRNVTEAGSYYCIITNTLGGKTATTQSKTCVVTKAGSQTVEITSSVKTVEVGKTITLTATAPGTISWSSYDTNVATVNSSTGVVTGKKIGKTTIAASSGSLKATIEITVTEAQTVTVTSSVNTVESGKTIQLTATASPTGTIAWTSSDTSVATVNGSTGVVTGVKAGKSAITATCNGVKDTVEITVTAAADPVKPTIITNLKEIDYLIAATVNLSVSATASDGGTLSYEWFKDGTKIDGQTSQTLMTMDPGEYYIKITNTLNGKTASIDSTKCTVAKPSVKINTPDTYMVYAGDTLQLTATPTPDATITWESSDTAVATIDSNGKITAVQEGTTTITATANKASDTIEITVVAAPTSDDPQVPTITKDTYEFDGTTLAVEASVTDGGTLSYQWYKDGVIIPDATSDKFEVTETGDYYAVITNTKDGKTAEAISTIIYVSFQLPPAETPTITKDLDPVVSTDDLPITLETEASVTDGGTLSYQWYKDDEAITDATSDKLEVTEYGSYHVAITNTITDGIPVTVMSTVCVVGSTDAPVPAEKPTITTDLNSHAYIVPIGINPNVMLSVVASVSDGGTLSYQWYKDGTALANETSDSLMVQISKLGSYYVVVTNTKDGDTASAQSNTCVVGINSSGLEFFVLNGTDAAIDPENKTVTLELPFGVLKDKLTPSIELEAGFTISPSADEAQDFSEPVIYTVTSSDGSNTQEFTVIVTPYYVIGDPSGDGEIGITDALMIFRYMAGIDTLNATQEYLCDVNGVDGPGVNDALLIFKYIASLDCTVGIPGRELGDRIYSIV